MLKSGESLEAPVGLVPTTNGQGETAPGPSDQPKRVTTLAQLIEKYMADPAKDRSQKTVAGYTVIFRVLKELLGEKKDIRAVTIEDCETVRDILRDLPPNFSKIAAYRGKTAPEIAKLARKDGRRRMSDTTVNSYLNNLSSLFNWAKRKRLIEFSPAEGLRVAVKTRKEDRQLPFSTDQLQALFSAPLYTGCQNDALGYSTPGPNRPRRGRFWVPLLSLFGGLRLNEACQLLVEDIEERDGVPVILVRPDEDGDKRVKTAAGRRVVPVHPELERIGFLEHFETIRDAGEERLFPELEKGKSGYYSDPFSKWFSRFQDKAGAAKKRTSFHSFRHSFRDALREAGTAQEIVEALGGWASTAGTSSIYGAGHRASTLAKEIANVRYEGLGLSHLYDHGE